MAFPLSPNRHARFLLLAPSNTSTAVLPDTLARIQHLASLTGGTDAAIVFLLNAPVGIVSARTVAAAIGVGIGSATPDSSNPSHPSNPTGAPASTCDGLHAYTALQAALLERTDVPHVPILPLATLDALPELVKSYLRGLGKEGPKTDGSAARPEDLLAVCTTMPPMSDMARFVCSDVFASLRELAVAAVSSTEEAALARHDGFEVLREQVGEQEVQAMVEFWIDEFTAD